MKRNLTNIKEQSLKQRFTIDVVVFFDDSRKEYFRFTPEMINFHLTFTLNKLAYGSFLWNDIDGSFFNKFILSGGEFISISMSTKNTKDGIEETYKDEFVFYGYKIIDKKDIKLDANKNRFEIYFCSPAQLKSNQTTIRRGWLGNKRQSDIVEDIMKTELGIDPKKITIIPTKSKRENFISPNLHPKELIDELKKESEGELSDFYVFFQNRKGYSFIPFSEIMKQEPVIAIERSKGGQKSDVFLTKIEKEDSLTGIDVLRSLKSGELGSTHAYFDRKSKKMKKFETKLDKKRLDSVYTTGKYGIYNTELILKDAPNSFYDIISYSPDLVNEFRYDIYSNMFKNNIFEFTMAGNLMLDVGDVFFMPIQLNGEEYNNALTGNWSVMEIDFRWSATSETKQMGVTSCVCEYKVVKTSYESFMNDTFNKESLLKTKKNINVLTEN